MSPEIWAGLLGVGGVLAGVFAERWFQRRGKIRCTFGELFVRAYNNSATVHEGGLPVNPKAVEGLAYKCGPTTRSTPSSSTRRTRARACAT